MTATFMETFGHEGGDRLRLQSPVCYNANVEQVATRPSSGLIR